MQLLRDTPRVPADAQSSQTIYTTERERLTADRQMSERPTASRCPYPNRLRSVSNQSPRSPCVKRPSPIRITAIMTIQIKRRNAPLTIAITRKIPSIAAIIRNMGELMNSGIMDGIPYFTQFEPNRPFPSLLKPWQQQSPRQFRRRRETGYTTSTQQSVRHTSCAGNNRLWR